MRSIFVIIANWNGKADTIECLKSLEKATAGKGVATLVVDNGSTDGSAEEISKSFPNIITLENKRNLGFTGGNNVGINYALKQNGNYILLLNNDTIVSEDFLAELLKVADSDPQIGIVVPKIYFAPGFEFHKDKYLDSARGKVIWYAGGIMDWKNIIGSHRGVDSVDQGQYSRLEETELATGCCMLIKKEVFREVGLLDKNFYLYYEDADFSLKAKKAGFKIFFVPQAVIWHKNAGSAQGSGSNLQDYYISRNRLIFGTRWASPRTKLALLKESFKLLFSGRPWQKKGVLDFYLKNFGRGSYPI